jgi:hypothetical protein
MLKVRNKTIFTAVVFCIITRGAGMIRCEYKFSIVVKQVAYAWENSGSLMKIYNNHITNYITAVMLSIVFLGMAGCDRGRYGG